MARALPLLGWACTSVTTAVTRTLALTRTLTLARTRTRTRTRTHTRTRTLNLALGLWASPSPSPSLLHLCTASTGGGGQRRCTVYYTSEKTGKQPRHRNIGKGTNGNARRCSRRQRVACASCTRGTRARRSKQPLRRAPQLSGRGRGHVLRAPCEM